MRIADSSSSSSSSSIILPVRDYDLAATLDSGQVFRWQRIGNSWIGVVGKKFVRLTQIENGIRAETAAPIKNWQWLRDFLQTEIDLAEILKTFPDDAPMNNAVAACRGLRVLRQDPWECLASFILSSTKQIVQIRQIVSQLCECFGQSVTLSSPKGGEGRGEEASIQIPSPQPSSRLGGAREKNSLCFAFPSAEKIASLTESQLRGCKMGFRAPNLLAAARQIADGKMDLEKIRELPLAEARHELMKLRGVGEKIANCVLLFAYGFDSAFPVDVWIERALQQLYFPRRRVSEKKLRHFAAPHFGPHAGYAQQYLFHYMRTKLK
ncbi:MAG TPA: DNA glycosylase [Methylomirabilota bacterium]|nr:DNA glycosylase [Methylomirabilota bacterium]